MCPKKPHARRNASHPGANFRAPLPPDSRKQVADSDPALSLSDRQYSCRRYAPTLTP
jgi:hypothetical protein